MIFGTYTICMMPKRSRKEPKDINQLAKTIVEEATKESYTEEPPEIEPPEERPERKDPSQQPPERKEPPKDPTEEPTGKNPAAVALGRLGGLKGGKARANKLSAKRRKEIAQKAAKARWAKNR